MLNWRKWTLVCVSIAAIAALVSLGNWQTRRAQSRLLLQAQLDAAEHKPPRTLIGTNLPAVGQALPMRVRVTGRFLHQHTVWLDNRTLDGRAGFLVLTPLMLDDGHALVVQRGWIERDFADRARLPAIGEPQEEVTIEGLAIDHPPRVLALGRPPPEKLPAIWQNLDFDAFERASGLPVARFVLRQTSSANDGLIRRWSRIDAGADKNRGYALQWYSLAALLAGLTFFFSWRAGRTGRDARRDASSEP